MSRLRSVLLAVAACTGIVTATPSHAVSTLAYTFVVDCADDNGVSSDELAPLTFPTGTYAVTISGFCSYGTNRTTDVSTCPSPVGGVPCADLHDVPLPCQYSTGGVGTDDCGTNLVPSCWQAYRVEVDGQCVTFDNVGFITHTAPGPITARFLDNCACYADNVGAFLVTVTWTAV